MFVYLLVQNQAENGITGRPDITFLMLAFEMSSYSTCNSFRIFPDMLSARVMSSGEITNKYSTEAVFALWFTCDEWFAKVAMFKEESLLVTSGLYTSIAQSHPVRRVECFKAALIAV